MERQPHHFHEQGKGWHKPEPKETISSLKQKIDALKAELDTLQAKHDALVADAKLEAIVEIRNLMRSYNLTEEDLVQKPRKKRGQRKQT